MDKYCFDKLCTEMNCECEIQNMLQFLTQKNVHDNKQLTKPKIRNKLHN